MMFPNQQSAGERKTLAGIPRFLRILAKAGQDTRRYDIQPEWRNGMKIYDRSLTGSGTAETGRTQETQRADQASAGRKTGGAGNGDRVELSGALSLISQALTSFGSSRTARVQELTAQYQNGSYQADSAATSRALVSEVLAAGAN
jgi:anti-sigma28 factor (negative regulator of flagellin synthesis)